MRVLAVLLTVGVSLAGDNVPQTPRTEKAGLVVSVVDSVSGKPIPDIFVHLAGDGTELGAETDEQGHASFPEFRPGAWKVHAEREGYVDLLDLESRGRSLVQSIVLTRTAAIAGQVLDFQGKPYEGGKVVAIVRRQIHGESRVLPFGEFAHADDRGNYRLFGLPPGHYSVAVVPIGDDPGAPVFAPVRFPEFFELKPGETRTSVNLTMTEPEMPTLSGKVSGIPEGEGEAGVSLAPRAGLRDPIAGVIADSTGTFAIHNVPPGEYQLTAWSPVSGHEANARAAVRTVTVPAGGLQVDMELRPLVTTTGRLTNPCSGSDRMVFRSEDGWPDDLWEPSVTVNGDRFTVEGLPAGRYRIEIPELGSSCRLAAPSGIVVLDGAASLNLVLTSATGGISGTAAAKAGVVVLAPADREGAVQVAKIDSEGHYRFSQVVAGEYLLVAMDGLNSTDYLDPIEAPKLGAKRVVVEAGKQVTSDLMVVRK